MSDFNESYGSGASPDDLWQAVKTPLDGAVASLVYPDIAVSYEGLDEDDQIRIGTRITYVPSEALLERAMSGLGLVSSLVKIPRGADVTLRVEDLTPKDKTRMDVLESKYGQGMVRRRVETAENSTGILVVEAQLSLMGIGNMFGAEDKLIAAGVGDPSQRTVDHVAEIIRS